MARKPLIDPNVLNQGGSTPLSTISRIIQKDREASGRGVQEEEAANAPTGEQAHQLTGEQEAATTSEPAHELTGEPVNRSKSQPDIPPTSEPVNSKPSGKSKRVSEPTGEPVNKLTAKDRRRKAEGTVEELAETPNKQIGPRIPSGWDDWLEDYVFARRKSGLQKQDLIRGLIRDFIVNELAKQEEGE